MSERATPETDAFYLRRVCAIDEEGIRAEWKHCERHARRLERERDENEGAFRVWRRRCEEAERQRDALAEALRELLARDERNTCQHEDTHRGGFLWEICDMCGEKWADDEGGRPAWEDPPEWTSARALLAELEAKR